MRTLLVQQSSDVSACALQKSHHESGLCDAQMTYEAYGAGGTGFVIECLTDNVNRSATEVRMHGMHGMHVICDT